MGVVAGLVAITPGAGYVPIWSAVIFGLFAGICSSLATQLKHILPIDDAMDVFAVHAVGGFVGNICTGKSKPSVGTCLQSRHIDSGLDIPYYCLGPFGEITGSLSKTLLELSAYLLK